MQRTTSQVQNRRAFLRFAATSPYVAALGGIRSFAQKAPELAEGIASVLANPKDALSVMDFEEAARRKVMTGHWAYMASGVDDDETLRANREGYKHFELRPRRLRDATKVDMRTELFGATYNSPIFTCPTGGEKFFHADGEDKHYGFYPTNGRVRLSRFDGPDVLSWKVLREAQPAP